MSTETLTLPESALPPEGGAEYQARMVAKFDGVKPPEAPPTEQPKTEEQPKLYAGKYKTVEDMEKGYIELQKMRSQAPQAPQTPSAPAPSEAQANAAKALGEAEKAASDAAAKASAEGATDADRAAAWAADQALKSAKAAKEAADKAPSPDVEAAKKAVEGAGLDFNAMSTEFTEKGELSPETFEALEKGGIPRQYVEQFIAGQAAIGERMRQEVFDTAGGEDAYREMLGWASKALNADDQTAFNTAVNGPDRAAAKLAVSGLRARYAAEGGVEPRLLGGDTNSGTVGFKSEAEWRSAMKDPKYRTDESFRDDVMRRLAVSKF